jgi:hypothetical protein
MFHVIINTQYFKCMRTLFRLHFHQSPHDSWFIHFHQDHHLHYFQVTGFGSSHTNGNFFHDSRCMRNRHPVIVVGLVENKCMRFSIHHFNTSLWDHIDGHIAIHICFEMSTRHTYHQKNPAAKIRLQCHASQDQTSHFHTSHSHPHRLQMGRNHHALMTVAMNWQ